MVSTDPLLHNVLEFGKLLLPSRVPYTHAQLNRLLYSHSSSTYLLVADYLRNFKDIHNIRSIQGYKIFWTAVQQKHTLRCQDNFANCNQTPLNSSRISLPKDNKHCTGGGWAAVFLFRQRPSSLCWVFPAGPDNAPWCDLCSAEPDTAVATLRTHRTEVDPFRCSPPPLHLFIASFPAWLCPSLRSFFHNCDPGEHVNCRNVNCLWDVVLGSNCMWPW